MVSSSSFLIFSFRPPLIPSDSFHFIISITIMNTLFFSCLTHKNITLSEHLIAYIHEFLLGVLGSLTFNRCLESFSLRTMLLICKLVC